jgi:hypothetical protein
VVVVYHSIECSILAVVVPQGFWQNRENQRSLLDWLGHKLKVQHWTDWYKIPGNDIAHAGGGSLLNCYIDSPAQLLQTLYPEFEWLPWKFTRVTDNFWEVRENVKQYFDWEMRNLGLSTPQDLLYRTTTAQKEQFERPFTSSPRLLQALKWAYPGSLCFVCANPT